MAPAQFELPAYQTFCIGLLQFFLTVGVAFTVLNCVMSILIEVYASVRKSKQLRGSETAEHHAHLTVLPTLHCPAGLCGSLNTCLAACMPVYLTCRQAWGRQF